MHTEQTRPTPIADDPASTETSERQLVLRILSEVSENGSVARSDAELGDLGLSSLSLMEALAILDEHGHADWAARILDDPDGFQTWTTVSDLFDALEI